MILALAVSDSQIVPVLTTISANVIIATTVRYPHHGHRIGNVALLLRCYQVVVGS